VLRDPNDASAAQVCRDVLKSANQFEEGGLERLAFWRRTVREDRTALAMVRRVQASPETKP
jgi:hypothetical protein